MCLRRISQKSDFALSDSIIKKNGAGEGNRTLVRSMGSSYSAIELRPPWRRGRDSNPRYLAVCMISSHVHSTRLCHLSVENKAIRYHISPFESRVYFKYLHLLDTANEKPYNLRRFYLNKGVIRFRRDMWRSDRASRMSVGLVNHPAKQ